MSNFRDYETAWLSPEGADYRKDFYERQRFGGTKPLLDNPTVSEVIADLEKHNPQSILEIGCGFGRLLEPVAGYFSEIPVVGCDVSKEMLDLCPEKLRTAKIDIINCNLFSNHSLLNGNLAHIGFCKGVFMYFNSNQIRMAMDTVSCWLVLERIIVYEWPFVCKKMKNIFVQYMGDSELEWEYHELLEKDE